MLTKIFNLVIKLQVFAIRRLQSVTGFMYVGLGMVSGWKLTRTRKLEKFFPLRVARIGGRGKMVGSVICKMGQIRLIKRLIGGRSRLYVSTSGMLGGSVCMWPVGGLSRSSRLLFVACFSLSSSSLVG